MLIREEMEGLLSEVESVAEAGIQPNRSLLQIFLKLCAPGDEALTLETKNYSKAFPQIQMFF